MPTFTPESSSLKPNFYVKHCKKKKNEYYSGEQTFTIQTLLMPLMLLGDHPHELVNNWTGPTWKTTKKKKKACYIHNFKLQIKHALSLTFKGCKDENEIESNKVINKKLVLTST